MSIPIEIRLVLLRRIQEISATTGVKASAILGRSRHQKVAEARALFVWLADVTTSATTEQIAEFIHRDRTTVIHLMKVGQALIEQRPVSAAAGSAIRLRQEIQFIPPPQPIPSALTVPQIHPHLHQPAKPMTLRTATPNHKLNVPHIAQAAREIQAVLDRFAADPLTTDLEALVLLRETSSHCMSHYGDIRTRRRMAGLEADPHNDNRGLESWIAMAETAADAPAPKRTHPARNVIPASSAVA